MLNPLRSGSSDPTTAYNNIAWCGLCQPLHSQFLVSEIQSRHAIATFMGRLELPPLSRQLADIQEKREHMRVQFKDSPRHTMMVSVSVLDELGEDLGVTPTLGRLLRTGSFEKLRAAVKWRCFLDLSCCLANPKRATISVLGTDVGQPLPPRRRGCARRRRGADLAGVHQQ